MMRLPYLRRACASVQAFATKAAHSVHSRFKSPARSVLLCGMVATLGASAWVIVSEINQSRERIWRNPTDPGPGGDRAGSATR